MAPNSRQKRRSAQNKAKNLIEEARFDVAMEFKTMRIFRPPPYTSALFIPKTFRFTSVGGQGPSAPASVTGANLLDMLCISTTAAAPFRVASAYRLRYIEIWSPATVGGVASCSIEYVFSGFGPSSVKSDSSMGGTTPAHVRYEVPSKHSTMRDWQSGLATVVALLTYGPSSVIEVGIVYIAQDDGATATSGVACANASAGAGVGRVFCRGLDGLAAAGSNYVSVGYPQI